MNRSLFSIVIFIGLQLCFAPNQAKADITDYFNQTLNHQDPSDNRTFKQRFYARSDWAVSKSAPVILFLCGEAPCNPATLSNDV